MNQLFLTFLLFGGAGVTWTLVALLVLRHWTDQPYDR
jgi:hypothetical protein